MEKKLFRQSGPNAMLFGICAGVAKYFDVDVTLVRAATVILSFLSVGTFVLIYVALAFVIPKEEI